MTSPTLGSVPASLSPGVLSPYGDCLFWDPELVTWLWVGHISKAIALLVVIGVLCWVSKQLLHRPQLRSIHIQVMLLLLLVAVTNVVEIFKLYYVFAIYWSIVLYNIGAALALVMAFNLPFRVQGALQERKRP